MTDSKVVPVEPTAEMVNAGSDHARLRNHIIGADDCAIVYKAMIAAAPTPEQSEVERLAHELADLWASRAINNTSDWHESGWFDVGFGAYSNESHYLELRGLLEHHPTDPNLVRVKS